MISEGDDTACGQALFPVPANGSNDPLQVGTRGTLPSATATDDGDIETGLTKTVYPVESNPQDPHPRLLPLLLPE